MRHPLRLGHADFADTIPTTQPQALRCPPSAASRHADPVASGAISMRRHRRTRNAVALVLALAVIGYAARLIWPLA